MTHDPSASAKAEPMQSDHERKVAEIEESRVGTTNATDPTADPGRRPTSAEDVAADQEAETPPHPSPAEGGSTEGSPRPPRPSPAEGER